MANQGIGWGIILLIDQLSMAGFIRSDALDEPFCLQVVEDVLCLPCRDAKARSQAGRSERRVFPSSLSACWDRDGSSGISGERKAMRLRSSYYAVPNGYFSLALTRAEASEARD